MHSSQFWLDLKLGRKIQSQIVSSRQRDPCLVCIIHQTQDFQEMNVLGTLLYFYFDQQGVGVPKTINKL